MPPAGKSLCLNMIVKNEMVNLERCLEAVAPYITCWVIGDTGSTDGTQDYIQSFFAERGIPGELHSFPFKNFAQARNEALKRARASELAYDYLLLTDADMEWTVQDPDFAKALTAAGYRVVQRAGVTYWNNRLVRRDAKAEYKGVTHEYLDVQDGATWNLEGVSFIDHGTGANRFEKYERDARLLNKALKTERDPGMVARYTFYLANTYRESGQKEAAIETYLKRVALGHWQQEVFISLLNVAKLKESLNHDPDEVIAAFVTAAEADPGRAEAFHAASRYCRGNGRHERGYQFAAEGLRIAYPNEALFVDDWIYDYGLLDELAINAYWTGRYDESVSICDRLLSEGKLPKSEQGRVRKNKDFAVERLKVGAAVQSAPAGTVDDLFQQARNKEASWASEDDVIAAYAAASAADPANIEVLYWAARYCRTHGLNDRGCEFAMQALARGPSDDPEKAWIYEYGLQEELSIVANYAKDPKIKDLGFSACNWLALNRDIPEDSRNLALSNLRFYMKSALEMMPSFKPKPLGYVPPDGYLPTNPSIVGRGDGFIVVQRAVNYVINKEFPDGDVRRYKTPAGDPIKTRNFLLRLDDELQIRSSQEILAPADLPDPQWTFALGFEDMRPFLWRDQLWTISCLRELSREGWCDQVLARLDESKTDDVRLVDWQVPRPAGRRLHEKNWMPRVRGQDLNFVYLSDPTRIVDEGGCLIGETNPPIWAKMFRGGSQAVEFDGGWLALIHEARVRGAQREYRHRFVWLDESSRLRRVSKPFYFRSHGIEFAAGLAMRPDGSLVITYGIDDNEAWIGTVEAEDVRRILEDAKDLPSGARVTEVESNDAPAGETIFIHSSWRTSSTWFFFKLRELSDQVVGFNEPFNEDLITITKKRASQDAPGTWDSRHPAGRPYYVEYVPRISEAGGVALFDSRMPFDWFIPQSGLTGKLREEERQYIESLIEQASSDGKVAVLACSRTLGRVAALKRDFGGYHIFLHRNLWQQWLSYIFYQRRGVSYFYDTVADLTARDDDPFLLYLSEAYVRRAKSTGRPDGVGGSPWLNDVNVRRVLAGLPASAIFEMFVALHVYLYLHAQMTSDLTFDVTQVARNADYRSEVENRIFKSTGLAVDLSDATEGRPAGDVGFDIEGIDWREIGEHARVAVRMLSVFGDAKRLADFASSLLDDAYAEAQRTVKAPSTAPVALDAEHADDDELGETCTARSGLLTTPERSSQPSSAQPALERRLKVPRLIVQQGPILSAADVFRTLAPFLSAADSPIDRREASRALDSKIAAALAESRAGTLPLINCFYEVMSPTASHWTLLAATRSMRAVGHPVRVWSYSPDKLDFLTEHGVELQNAADLVPREIFGRVLGKSEIRYFSNVFRYAVLYEHGGLWIDTDVVMLRPFPFRGEYFVNLQWRDGGRGHFVCGNVMYAPPNSPHMRALYEQALDRAFADGWEFGDIGPKLLSDYIASAEGAPLREWLFSPMIFNSVDWTETELFERPLAELADYLNDERVVGVHLWNAKTNTAGRDDGRSLIALLSDPVGRLLSLSNLAERFETDKNRRTGNHHGYARVYERLLGDRRFALRKLMEIGFDREPMDPRHLETSSVGLWRAYFPFCHVVRADLTDRAHLNGPGFTALACDQSRQEDLEALVAALELGSFDVIIDDGSHASADQQRTIVSLWPLVREGGWYFIEDLDWQPEGEEPAKLPLTRDLLSQIQRGDAPSLDPLHVSGLAAEFEEVLFFDSHYELVRAGLRRGLVAIRKRRGKAD